MKIFLNACNPRVYNVIIDGCTHPNKPQSEWTPTKVDAHKFNFRALNVIASSLALDEFRRIAHLNMTKEAWKFLSVTHEGTNAVKMSKLQMYMTQLKTLKMKEDEEIFQFNANFSNLVNIMRSLREDIHESKVIRNVHRSHPKRFRLKVTTVEESKDLEAMKLE